MLYLGYISITIPFAFAIAALLSRKLDTGWIHAMRQVDAGVAGSSCRSASRSACGGPTSSSGWGGYWAWDPVENASLLPWLTHDRVPALGHDPGKARHAEALEPVAGRRHVPAQHLRDVHHPLGRHRRACTASPSRTSATSSSRSCLLSAIALLHAALHPLAARSRPRCELESMVSREAAFLFNNLLFVGIAFSVLWGTLFPILSEAVRGTKITVGPALLQQGERAARPAAARR